MDIIQAIHSEQVFRNLFKDVDTWRNWYTFFRVLFNLPLEGRRERQIFRECTGLRNPPREPIKECFICAGRRSGKSTACSLLAVFYAIWGDWEKYLSRGEKARIFVIATNKEQAKIVKSYIEAILDLNKFFRSQIKRQTSEEIEFNNNVIITIKPASWRTTRGFSVGLLIMEELAFWRYETESAIPDTEIYLSIKPGMTTIKNSLTIGISTPFARQGLLFEKFQKHWGKPGNVLMWRAPTWIMNQSLSEKEIEKEYRELLGDAAYFAEYACHWREDVESFLPMEVIEDSIMTGVKTIPYSYQHEYFAFCDPSEGMRKNADAMTLAVGHFEKNGGKKRYILDHLDSIEPPFDNKEVIEIFAHRLKYYSISKVVQDRHAVGWIEADFREHEITVEVSKMSKSEIYDKFAILMNKRSCELLDVPKLKREAIGLERRQRSGGFSKVDHRPGNYHDDLINAVAGCFVLCQEKSELEPLPLPSFGIYEEVLTQEEIEEREARKWLCNDKPPKEKEPRLGREIDEDGNVIDDEVESEDEDIDDQFGI